EGLLGGGGFCNGDKAAFAGGFGYAGQPVIISEYGGIAFASGAVGGAWGYGAGAESEADFLERLCAMAAAIRQLPYVRGYCYTQLTDVQQEVNGLMDAGRNFKAGCAAIREINEI
ncbi:MAG: glycoside hydrolase family 2, partial [Clostridiales bacterium]|nr:glycoside hydrolase family 2 [Clostridiales bacterium]